MNGTEAVKESGSASPERRVQELLRNVFRGRVPENSQEVIDKFNQLIVTREVEGRTIFEVSSRPLGGTSGSVGGLSIAQASLYARAQAAYAEAKSRLATLKPLQQPAADPENVEALRAVTLIEYRRLVNELGRAGGLREQWIDKLFEVLLGPQGTGDVELGSDSLLKKIQTEYGLEDSKINSPEEHENVINYRIVNDALADLYRGWRRFKTQLVSDFGELSGEFSRQLALIEEAVTDVESELDEASIDIIAREIFKVDAKLTLDDLLSWIREFATEEAPLLVADGGRIGIGATKPTLAELKRLVGSAKEKGATLPTTVKDALNILEQQLVEASKLADTIVPPAPKPSGSVKSRP